MTLSKKNFLDAKVFVYAATQAAHTKEADTYVREAGVTDALAVAEAFGAIKRITKSHSAAFAATRKILSQFEVLPVDAKTIFQAMKMQNLHIADAIHVVNAEGYNFISFDKDFTRKK